jgi:molybdopterin-guanine dinucleotide biosynthesis protein A
MILTVVNAKGGAEVVEASGVILAGGQSQRLGRDKAFLEVNGVPLIQRVTDVLACLSDDLVIVTNAPERYRQLPGRLVGDVYPGKGALGGIYSGVLTARYHYSLVVACDMPFLNPDLLRYLMSLAEGYDAVIPVIGEGMMEAVHAVYSKACLPFVKELLLADELRIVNLFPRVRVRYVQREELLRLDPILRSFLNVNTPADWEMAERLAGGE